MSIAVLAIGSNMGDKLTHIASALDMLGCSCKVLKKSNVYETPPAFFLEQDNFYNCAVSVSTQLDAFELLKLCKKIESDMGRIISFRNAPRPIDLDIIFYEDEHINTDALIVPHIDWQNRDFVITPLLDLFDKEVFDSSCFIGVKNFLKDKTRTFEKIAEL